MSSPVNGTVKHVAVSKGDQIENGKLSLAAWPHCDLLQVNLNLNPMLDPPVYASCPHIPCPSMLSARHPPKVEICQNMKGHWQAGGLCKRLTPG